MNAITHTEAQARQTVAPVQPSQSMLLVPLSQLRASKRNVRKTAGQSIDALAASDNAPDFRIQGPNGLEVGAAWK